jgi:hypothetical protein
VGGNKSGGGLASKSAPPQSFSAMPVAKFFRPLPQGTLDIEEKKRGNIFTWRGQFSPQLIESLLNAYCPTGVSVFDPFGGSGTVLYECAILEKEAHVTELNPAAWILSRTYELANQSVSERKAALATVRTFFSKKFPQQIFSEESNVLSLESLTIAVEEFNAKARTEAEQQVFSATIVLLDVYAKPATPERIELVLSQLSKKALALPEVEFPVRAHLADARKTPFEDDTFGFVVSSPPYINVFNYHQNYRASTELLGWDLLKVARSEIGSNRANRGNRFLTVAQYCFDMGGVLEELRRVCRKDANIILVVGRESAVLGVSWKNSEIVRRLAEESGYFKCGLVQERKFTNKFGATIYEDLLHLTPIKKAGGGIRKFAEAIAQDVFGVAIKAADKKTAPLLEKAAEKIPDLGGTPVFTY